MVIFGANGDLTKRKLLPALYRLAYERRLRPGFAVIGISRTAMSDDEFRAKMREPPSRSSSKTARSMRTSGTTSPRASSTSPATSHDPACTSGSPTGSTRSSKPARPAATFCSICPRSPAITAPRPAASAAPAWQSAATAGAGSSSKSHSATTWPAPASSKDQLHEGFPKRSVYRIDHYLGKETVQNILAFRFGNGIFEPLWNRRYISHVQITAAESIGVEGRGAYYQEAGALRDMIQNHLLQVMATVAMEPQRRLRAHRRPRRTRQASALHPRL